MKNTRQHSAFLVIGIFLLGASMRAPFTSIPSVINEIAASFHTPATSLGILTTIPLICFGLCSTLVPAIAQRLGNELTLFVALIMLSIGSFLRIHGFSALMIGTLMIGITTTFINVLLPAVISENLPTKIGPVTGTYNVALTLFSAIGAYAIAPISAATSWQFAVELLSLLVLITALVWTPNLRFNYRASAAEPTEAGANMWKNRRAWYLLMYFAGSSFVFYTIVAWLPSIAMANGMSNNSASLIAGLFQLFSIPTAFAIPVLATKLTNRMPLVLSAGLMTSLGFLAMLLPIHQFWFYVLIALLLGLGTAATFALIMTLFGLKTRSVADTRNLSGMVQSLGYLLAAFGPTVTGNLKAITHSWNEPIIVTFVVICLFTLFGALSEHHRYVN
jgi:MFS transporter, CP family, cyanate transporter